MVDICNGRIENLRHCTINPKSSGCLLKMQSNKYAEISMERQHLTTTMTCEDITNAKSSIQNLQHTFLCPQTFQSHRKHFHSAKCIYCLKAASACAQFSSQKTGQLGHIINRHLRLLSTISSNITTQYTIHFKSICPPPSPNH